MVAARTAICGTVIGRTIATFRPFGTARAAFALLFAWCALFGFTIVLRKGFGFDSIGRTLIVIIRRTIIILPIVAVFAIIFAWTTLALLILTGFLAAAEIGEDAEIMVGELQVILSVYAVTVELRVLRQLFVFLQHLRCVSARTIVDLVLIVETAAIVVLLTIIIVVAATATIVVLLLPVVDIHQG